jgi:tetratricopeptide (TPR) repeat protein
MMAQFFDIDNLTTFYQKNPNSIAFAYLGSRLIDKGEYQEAIDLCRQGVQRHPQYAFGHYILGMAYYHLKNYNEAKKELELSLSYDPATPKGWEMLSAVNEILNLSDDATDSNLNSYLYDVFNQEAVNNFIVEKKTVQRDEEQIQETKEKTDINIFDSDEELTDKDIDELISTTTEKEDKGDDFLKTLDDVFIEKGEDLPETGPELTEETDEEEMISDDELNLDDIKESKEDIVSAQEFTSAIDSFFSEYEEKGTEEETEVENENQIPDEEETKTTGPVETEGTEEISELDFEDFKIDETEQTDESEQEQEQPKQKYGPVFEVPEEDETTSEATSGDFDSGEFDQSDQDLIDITSVVSDLIEEEEKDSEAINDISSEQDQTKEEPSQPEEKAEEKAPPEPEKKEQKQPAIKTPDVHELDQTVELKEDSEKSEGEAPKKETAQFGRPPILSPTLGEIYIAQGRFEEAIDVFQQLLEKDPESARFKRKIQDLEMILQKRNMK